MIEMHLDYDKKSMIMALTVIAVIVLGFGLLAYNNSKHHVLPVKDCILPDSVPTEAVVGVLNPLPIGIYSINLNTELSQELGFDIDRLSDTTISPDEFVTVTYKGQTITAQAFGLPEMWLEGSCVAVSSSLAEILDLKLGDVITLERND